MKKIIKRKLFFILFFIQIIISISCSNSDLKNDFIDEELFVKVPESELYTRIRGNPHKPLIVNLHGGPGGYSGIDIKQMGPGLEDNFLVAYLDQRGCGKSPWELDSSMLTIAQYIDDLNFVIDTLSNHYKKEKVNLVGTSWGGMYGFLYLLEHQEKVNAFACIDGKVNSEYQNNSLIEYELYLVSEKMKQDISENKKQKLKEIEAELFRIKGSNFEQFYLDVNKIKHEYPPILGFNAYFVDTSKIISIEDVLNDSLLLSLMKYTAEEYLGIGKKAEIVNKAFRNTPNYNNLNIESDLKNIKIPVAVIQGEKDFVVGVKQGELIFNALTGLPESKKVLHIIPDVGHCPAIESRDVLIKILLSFFKKY
jgi:pimeloyl-ACP methyl ester carboxylesterase